MNERFLIRTTTTVSRDFVVECENKAAAEKIAVRLAYDTAPPSELYKAIATVRDDVDVSSSVAAAAENFNDLKATAVPMPPWLRND